VTEQGRAQPLRATNNKAWILSTGASIAFILSCILYLRPYHGIRHDSILYLGQALLTLNPIQMQGDLFFVYGGQANFTIFPYIFGELLRQFPAGDTFATFTLVGMVMFSLASWALACKVFPVRFHFWCVVAVLVMPAGYGARYIFAFAEPFLTARTLAEPLALLAVAAALGGRWAGCALALVVGFVLHPLQTIPAVTVAFLIAIKVNGRVRYVGVAAALLLLLSLTNESWRTSALLVFDAEWLEWASDASPYAFFLKWRAADWCHLLTDVFLVVLTARIRDERVKTVARLLLLVTSTSLCATFIFADVLNLVFPTGLQFWRALWIFHWFALASIPLHIARLYGAGVAERPRLTMLLAIIIIGAPIGSASTPWPALPIMALYVLWPYFRHQIGSVVAKALVIALCLGVALHFMRFAILMLATGSVGAEAAGYPPAIFVIGRHPLVVGAIVIMAHYAWSRSGVRQRQALAAAMMMATLPGLASWDSRDVQQRFLELSQGYNRAFGQELLPGGQVIWTDHLLPTWLVLNRPNYLSAWQMSGLLFSRKTAEEAEARAKVLESFGKAHVACMSSRSIMPNTDECPISQDVLKETCRGAQGKLSYVVMPYLLESGSVGMWSIPAAANGAGPITYHLYPCSS
jgi:hypothetical protein